MIYGIFFIGIFFSFFAQASLPEISSDLSSDQAFYDGEILQLNGQVFLNHDLGQMNAQSASLKKGGPLLEFSSIHLKDQVSIFFEDHGKLFSEEAFLDLEALKGTMVRGEYPIVYHGKDLELFCTELDLTLVKNENHFNVKTLFAKDDVHIEYLENYHLDCDKALYEKNMLTASSNSLNLPCHLTHLEDSMDAQKITFDLETELLTFYESKGFLLSFSIPKNSKEKSFFSSNLMTWDHQNKLLTMHGNIRIDNPSLGTLTGKNLFSLQQRTHLGQQVIQTIETLGETSLVDHNQQRLISYGTLKFDRDTLIIECTSPNPQLHYENPEISIYANSGSIEYAFHEMNLKPHIINLDGEIKILSHTAQNPLRKGLADHIIYDPLTKETRLLAAEGNSVLFWDDKKNLTLSAPEIRITIDPETQEEIIQGIGVVHFTFSEEEEKRFKLF